MDTEIKKEYNVNILMLIHTVTGVNAHMSYVSPVVLRVF